MSHQDPETLRPSSRRINLDKITDRRRDSALKELAGIISKLSYRDMLELAKTWDAKNGERGTADRFMAVAEAILSRPEEPVTR